MHKAPKRIGKYAVLFLVGGCAYLLIELLFRGHTHWTMGILGGACFLLIGGLNNWFPWRMPLLLQGVIGGAIVTALELYAGLILNVQLGLAIWDYSKMPLNLWGQICLPFSLAWVGLSIVAVVLDDWLRYWLFGEPRPRYNLFRWELLEPKKETRKVEYTWYGFEPEAKGYPVKNWRAETRDVESEYDAELYAEVKRNMADGADHCVFCGKPVPEGTQVCPSCELKLMGR